MAHNRKHSLKKICIVCGKTFDCYPNNRAKHHNNSGTCHSYKRPINCKTCSHKCSKIKNTYIPKKHRTFSNYLRNCNKCGKMYYTIFKMSKYCNGCKNIKRKIKIIYKK